VDNNVEGQKDDEKSSNSSDSLGSFGDNSVVHVTQNDDSSVLL
jgi:hypothetical protein